MMRWCVNSPEIEIVNIEFACEHTQILDLFGLMIVQGSF